MFKLEKSLILGAGSRIKARFVPFLEVSFFAMVYFSVVNLVPNEYLLTIWGALLSFTYIVLGCGLFAVLYYERIFEGSTDNCFQVIESLNFNWLKCSSTIARFIACIAIYFVFIPLVPEVSRDVNLSASDAPQLEFGLIEFLVVSGMGLFIYFVYRYACVWANQIFFLLVSNSDNPISPQVIELKTIDNAGYIRKGSLASMLIITVVYGALIMIDKALDCELSKVLVEVIPVIASIFVASSIFHARNERII